MIDDIKKIDDEVDDLITAFEISDEVSSDRFKKLKQQDMEFESEISSQDPKWRQQRKVEFINSKLIDIINDIGRYEKVIAMCPDQSSWFVEMVKEEFLADLIFKKNKYTMELQMWEHYNDVDLYSNTINSFDIETAADTDCSLFVDIKRKDGRRSWSLCPFHTDTHPSLCCFGPEKGFYCFSCGEGGNAIKLVMKIQDCKFIQAVKFILNK